MSTRSQALLTALAAGAAIHDDEELVAVVVHDLAPPLGPEQDLPEAPEVHHAVASFDGGTVGALPLEEVLELPEVELAELADALTLPVARGWVRVLEIDATGIVWLSWEQLDLPEPPVLLPPAVHADA